MSFIDRLQKLRAQHAPAPVAPNPPVAPNAPAKPAPAVQPNAPIVGDGQPAPKAAVSSAVSMRQTVGELFDLAAKAGLSGPFVARHTGALQQHTGVVKRLADAQGKAAISGRVLGALDPALRELDPRSAATAFGPVLELLARGLGALTPVREQALVELARAAGGVASPAIGTELSQAWAELRGLDDTQALIAARVLSGRAAGALVPVDVDDRPAFFKELVRAAAEGARGGAAPDGAGLPAAQKQVIGGVFNTAGIKRREAAENDLLFKDALGGLRELGADATRQARAALAPDMAHVWAQTLAQLDGERGPLSQDVLAQGLLQVAQRSMVVPAPALAEVGKALVQLAQLPGVGEAGVKKLIDEQLGRVAPTDASAVLVLVREIAQGIDAGVRAQRPELASELAEALMGRTKAFAQPNAGARPLWLGMLQAAGNDRAALDQALLVGHKVASSLASMEAGDGRQHLEAVTAQELVKLAKAGVDVAAVAAAYPKLPPESLPKLCSIAQRTGTDLDAFLDLAGKFFGLAGKRKDALRDLRTFAVLADSVQADVPALMKALLDTGWKPDDVTRNARAMHLNKPIDKAQLDGFLELIKKREEPALAISEKQYQAMAQQLGLQKILQDANVKATDSGRQQVQALQNFFTVHGNNAQVNKELVKSLLVAVLEGRYPDFRFETPNTEANLKCLSPAQKKEWMRFEVVTHVKLSPEAQAKLDERVKAASAIAKGLQARMVDAWGPLDDMRKEHVKLATALRDVNLNDAARRKKLIADADGLPAKIAALEWAEKVASLTPAHVTPLRFAAFGQGLPKLAHVLGAPGATAVNELLWQLRLDDLSYTEIVTNDGPDLPTLHRLATTNCLANDGTGPVMAYAIDPNKKMIITKNQNGEERRAVMRLVERTDKGHEGEPMLVLERSYPDAAANDEKRLLMEHVLRRAAAMGVAAAFPNEYYWDTSKTGRAQIANLNAELEDMERRYQMTMSRDVVTKVVNRATNLPQEYIDSAPLNGVANAGQVGIRRYPNAVGQPVVDTTYENRFMIFEPNDRRRWR